MTLSLKNSFFRSRTLTYLVRTALRVHQTQLPPETDGDALRALIAAFENIDVPERDLIPPGYIDVQGVTTRYWTGGGTGSPVVLVHGIGGYAENWLPTFGALATEHSVYALDVIGQGRTDKPPGGCDSHSNGPHPSRGSRQTCTRRQRGTGKECHMMFRLLGVPFLGEFLVRPSRSGTAMSRLPGAQKAFLKILRGCGNPLLGQDESVCGPNIRGLATITNPVLVVWGRQDKILPVAHAEVAAKNLPNVTVKLYDKCGHTPMLERPQDFNALLLEFLSD